MGNNRLTRCGSCRNPLPVNDRGYCHRCENGWDTVPLSTKSNELIQREIGLASFARDSFDEWGPSAQGDKMIAYIAKLRKELEER